MATTNRKIRILCVEDDPQMRTFLMNQLRVRGHQVQAVQDGAQAIDQAAIFQPELILLDLADTHVTDVGVAGLARLTNLRFLFLYRTRITAATRWAPSRSRPGIPNPGAAP